MDDTAEIYGSGGVAYADVLQGNSIQTYSTRGIGYAVEKAGNTVGWSFVMYEEIWNYGFPQEFQHFVGRGGNRRLGWQCVARAGGRGSAGRRSDWSDRRGACGQ